MSTDLQHYSVDDPDKIQGRDDVYLDERSLASLRLQRALAAIPSDSGRLLLPGSGAGRYARAIARYRPDWRIVAGDLSPQAIAEAQELGGGAEYLVFDAENPPFEDASFDALIFLDLVEHLPHPERFLAECHRVLKPAGVLHFFSPLENAPGTLYHALRNDRPIPIHRWKREHVGHIQRYTAPVLLQLLWDAHFEPREIAYSFHLIGQVHDVLDYWARERNSGVRGLLPAIAVRGLTRLAFIATWRLSYLEDRLYAGSAFASGVHITARRA
jgi:SAM-dependent methyltransferase